MMGEMALVEAVNEGNSRDRCSPELISWVNAEILIKGASDKSAL